MKEYNEEAVKRIEYRKNRLETVLGEIRDASTGMMECVLPRITDDDNRLDDGKLHKFVDDMVAGFNRYRLNVLNKEVLSENEEKLYKSFLYCTLVGPSIKSVLPDLSQVFDHLESTLVYKDIVLMAEEVFEGSIEKRVEKDMRSMHIIEDVDDSGYSAEPDFPDNEFFDLMNLGIDYSIRFREKAGKEGDEDEMDYIEIDEHNLKVSLKVLELIYGTEEQELLEQIYRTHSAEVTEKVLKREAWEQELKAKAASKSKMQEVVLDNGLKMTVPVSEEPSAEDVMSDDQDLCDEMQEEILCADDFPDVPWDDINEYTDSRMDREAEESWESAKVWYEKVPDMDLFINEYKSFRKLWFSVEHMEFARNIEQMVEIYLYENELSAMALGGEYGIVDDEVRQAAERICRKIRRKRAIWS